MIVNRSQFATLIGCSGPHVANLIREGMPASGAGKRGVAIEIDTAQAIPWLLERAQRRAEVEETGPRNDLIREQADRLAMQNAQTRSELVPIEQVEAVGAELIRQLDVAVMPMLDVADAVAASSDASEIRALLATAVRDAQRRFANAIEVMAGLPIGSRAPGDGR
jgi:phage terminase Nu1 subunit (DNA packaging protein)